MKIEAEVVRQLGQQRPNRTDKGEQIKGNSLKAWQLWAKGLLQGTFTNVYRAQFVLGPDLDERTNQYYN